LIFVVALLASVAVSSLCSYFENNGVGVVLCAVYVVLCAFMPGFAVFLPLVVYDCSGFGKFWIRFFWVAAILACFFSYDAINTAAIAFISAAAFIWQRKTAKHQKIQKEFYILIDNAKEQTINFEFKNRELMEKQDYELRLATLKERNRIAREIHDNVGHLLTRSILQLSAFDMSHPGNDASKNELSLIKNTMSDAMDSIRNSVHDLHDESVDLKMQLESMIGGFGFCQVKLRYDAGELPGKVKYCFIAVAREAFSNIARHSDATQAFVSVAEHPAFCRLSIEDNGTAEKAGNPHGIGLRGMEDRVGALGGVFRAEYDKGFKIFISVPKENKKI